MHFLNTRLCCVEKNRLFSGPATEPASSSSSQAPTSKRGVGGGAWRAWVSEKVRVSNKWDVNDMRQLAEMYRLMKERGGDDWQRLAHKGEIAKQAHAAGGSAFAATARGAQQNLLSLGGLSTDDLDIEGPIMERDSSALKMRAHAQDLQSISSQARALSKSSGEADELVRKELSEWSETAARESRDCKDIPFTIVPEPHGNFLRSFGNEGPSATPTFDSLFCAEVGGSMIDIARQAVQRRLRHYVQRVARRLDRET